MAYTAYEKLKCVEREIALRRAVYAKRIAAGTMLPSTADREIGIMEAIAADYRAQDEATAQ